MHTCEECVDITLMIKYTRPSPSVYGYSLGMRKRLSLGTRKRLSLGTRTGLVWEQEKRIGLGGEKLGEKEAALE